MRDAAFLQVNENEAFEDVIIEDKVNIEVTRIGENMLLPCDKCETAP